jgi:hypothetical protein
MLVRIEHMSHIVCEDTTLAAELGVRAGLELGDADFIEPVNEGACLLSSGELASLEGGEYVDCFFHDDDK